MPDGSLEGGLRAFLSIAVLFLGGCAGGYRASQLPAEFAAASSANLEAVDLSRLSHYATNSQLIERGDVLDVTLVTDFSRLLTSTAPSRVGDDGQAMIPLIGPVSVVGMELPEAEQAIRSAAMARNVFRNPQVTVVMRRKRTNRITVAGAVQTPGVYEIPCSSASLLSALLAAGGLASEAGPDVEIRRPLSGREGLFGEPPRLAQEGMARPVSYEALGAPTGPQVIHVNLMQTSKGGDRASLLQDGDVVFVPKQAPKPVYVLGLVKKPGEYKMPVHQDLYVLDALALAGGAETSVADKVMVVRRVPDRDEPVVIRVSISEAKMSGSANLRLAPGDIVSVEHTPQTVVVESIKTMLRFGFSATVF
mgnify:FL=1